MTNETKNSSLSAENAAKLLGRVDKLPAERRAEVLECIERLLTEATAAHSPMDALGFSVSNTGSESLQLTDTSNTMHTLAAGDRETFLPVRLPAARGDEGPRPVSLLLLRFEAPITDAAHLTFDTTGLKTGAATWGAISPVFRSFAAGKVDVAPLTAELSLEPGQPFEILGVGVWTDPVRTDISEIFTMQRR